MYDDSMWRSRMFWQLFGTYGVLILFSVGLLGFVLGSQVWTAAALTGFLALVLAFWLAHRIVKPISELTRGAEEIAAGAYGHRVYVEAGDEVGQLTRAFNRMSERLAAQFAQLDEDRQQLRTVLSSMVEGVVAVDPEQRVLFANERAGQLLEFATRNAVGRYLWELVRHRSIHEVIRGAMARDEAQSQELTWNGPGTRSLMVHVARLPSTITSPYSTGGTRGAVLVFHDNTELRRLERLRQEFVANVSHELKTPLAIIQACVETLIDGAIEDISHRGPFLERIADQTTRLHNLIIDLLRLARVESETEAFTRERLALDRIVHECLDKHRTLAEGKKHRLEVVPPPEAALAWADEEAVRQILDNLVDNAIKYTPEGGLVRVRWAREGNQVFFEIKDTGIGIADADLSRIFERFYRVDKARSRELGGTGLGLSIVKHLAQAMQGSIRASSRLGEGSMFTVYLPAVSGDGRQTAESGS
jgi:two-component system phosphate regulon sensor histidine kinase PhoR